MQTESALAAQGESCAGAPTGFRKLTPSLLQVDRAAEGFDGLPEGVTVPRAGAGRLEGGRTPAGAFAPPGARHRLAVQIHPAAGLGQGRAADRLALGLVAAGGARAVGVAA